MSALFDYMIGLKMGIVDGRIHGRSAGGIVRTEGLSPSYFTFDLDMPTMYEDKYRKIRAELLQFHAYASSIITTIPHEHAKPFGAWSGGGDITVSAVTGVFVTLSGFNPSVTTQVASGDLIQFRGDSKVYQVVRDADSDGSGNVIVELSSIMVREPNVSFSIRWGEDVKFQLFLERQPVAVSIPGRRGEPLYSFSEAVLLTEGLRPYDLQPGEDILFFEDWSNA